MRNHLTENQSFCFICIFRSFLCFCRTRIRIFIVILKGCNFKQEADLSFQPAEISTNPVCVLINIYTKKYFRPEQHSPSSSSSILMFVQFKSKSSETQTTSSSDIKIKLPFSLLLLLFLLLWILCSLLLRKISVREM